MSTLIQFSKTVAIFETETGAQLEADIDGCKHWKRERAIEDWIRLTRYKLTFRNDVLSDL